MGRLKLFLGNFIVYGIGGIISGIIPLIMIPIITRMMPTPAYYGLSDLFTTIVQLCSALAVMGMYDAMYRLFFETNDELYKKSVCSTTLCFTIIASIVVIMLMLAFRKSIAVVFFGTYKYSYLVFYSAIATLFTSVNNIISAPTRMRNKRFVFVVMNVANSLLLYSIAIILLYLGNYVTAIPIGIISAGLIAVVVFWALNSSWFSFRSFDKNLLIQLLHIALPLLPNFIVYWIFNFCDRVMISNLLGIEATGIYSVGAKLGLASQLIYVAFAGGWQYFAFSTMKEDDQVKSNSLVFEYLGIVSYSAAGLVCALSYGIISLLFEKEYIGGYIVAPYLFLAPLLQMLFQVAVNQFLVVKKTWPNLFILSFGAVLNIILNLLLIPVLGIEGAAIATLSGYIISDIICVIVLHYMKLMTLSHRFFVATSLMVLFFMIWRLLLSSNVVLGTIAAIGLMIVLALLYKRDICVLMNMIKRLKNTENKI